MSLLLHICCAPCSVVCVKMLREEGTEPTGFWYNPNIHPFLEYKARRDTLRQYAQDIGLDLRVRKMGGENLGQGRALDVVGESRRRKMVGLPDAFPELRIEGLTVDENAVKIE